MKKISYFLITVIFLLFTSCAIEDETQCITTLDCAEGMICIDGICVEDQGENSDNSTTYPDNSIADTNTVSDNEAADQTQDDVITDIDSQTPDEKADEVTDEIQDASVDDEITDEIEDTEVDETVDEDISTDNAVIHDEDSSVPDEIVDESVDTEVDEAPDEDTAEPLTCATAGITCGSNSHCEDGDGTPKCVCDTNYQDEDDNGTCLVSCALWDCNTSAFGNSCYISSGVATCSCNSFDGYTGTHCDECSYGYHEGGFGYENECFEDNCTEAEDTWHGWLDCWGSQVCDDSWGYAECTY